MSDTNYKPGIYSIAAERYHSAAGVSKSMLDILAEKTPAHLIAYLNGEAREETEAMRFGTILHRALLEPDTYKEAFHVRPDGMKFTTKAGMAWFEEHKDKPCLTSDNATAIERMVSAVHTHPFAKRLLAGALPEQSIFVEDGQGTLRKSRLDALTKGNVIPDVKSVESASLDAFQRSISRYRYHVQAAYYLDNCKLSGIDKEWFIFILVEKSPPYAVRCLRIDPEAVEAGRRSYQADLQTYRNCVNEDRWPAWSDDVEDCSLPEYEMRQFQAVS